MAKRTTPKGRGSPDNPANRFESVHAEADWEQVEQDDDFFAARAGVETEYLPDQSQSIVSENNSPDVGFRYSLNPYRGCLHGCSYCYARPTHEYLGMSAGLDFETKILYKPDAPALLRKFLARKGWQPDEITLSGVTDCYQPAEARFRLTRQCLEVALAARQPLSIITKNALIVRDLDLLAEMARLRLVHANISVTTLDAELGRVLEPRTSSPPARLRAIKELSEAGIPVRVMVAPVIPGLTDSEMPAILAAAAEAGAKSAGYVLLRLPFAVKPIFLDWLQRERPLARPRIEQLIRSMRGGELNVAKFGERMRGTGPLAEQIQAVFKTFRQRHGLDGGMPDFDFSQFQPPVTDGQLRLF